MCASRNISWSDNLDIILFAINGCIKLFKRTHNRKASIIIEKECKDGKNKFIVIAENVEIKDIYKVINQMREKIEETKEDWFFIHKFC